MNRHHSTASRPPPQPRSSRVWSPVPSIAPGSSLLASEIRGGGRLGDDICFETQSVTTQERACKRGACRTDCKHTFRFNLSTASLPVLRSHTTVKTAGEITDSAWTRGLGSPELPAKIRSFPACLVGIKQRSCPPPSRLRRSLPSALSRTLHSFPPPLLSASFLLALPILGWLLESLSYISRGASRLSPILVCPSCLLQGRTPTTGIQ